MFGVYISGSECFWKTFSIGFRSRQNSVFASAMAPPAGPGVGARARLRRAGRRRSAVAQLAAQDLAGRRLRHLVDDLDPARVLVRRHPLLAERDELLLAGRLALLEADERLHRLAAVLVGDADDGRLADGGVTVEDVLDLARPDLVAGRVDLVLLAVDEIEPAVLVHEADVAGLERAAGQRVLGLLGLLPVARHDLRPARHELADLARRQLLAVLADDLHDGVEHRHADRQRAGALVDRRAAVERDGVRRGRRLGEAVDV